MTTKEVQAPKPDPEEWRKLCYQDDHWHKWVLERLDDEQTEIYHRFKQTLEEHDIHFSENKILRFLAARNFDEDDALVM